MFGVATENGNVLRKPPSSPGPEPLSGEALGTSLFLAGPPSGFRIRHQQTSC